jgi:WD40 repeat protein
MVHGSRVDAAAFSPDGRTVLTSSPGAARLWGAADGTPMFLGVPLVAAAFSPDGKVILTGGVDGAARLWGAADGTPVGRTIQHETPVKFVAFSPDGKTFLTATEYEVRVWRAPEAIPGEPRRLVLWSQVITGMEFVGEGGEIRLLDATTWQKRREELNALGGPPSP